MKKQLKSLDSTELDFTENTKIFINESLRPYYRGIWNKCKKLRAIQKIHQFYTISSLIRVKLEETGPSRIITHMVDLKELFTDTDFVNISWVSLLSISWLSFLGYHVLVVDVETS